MKLSVQFPGKLMRNLKRNAYKDENGVLFLIIDKLNDPVLFRLPPNCGLHIGELGRNMIYCNIHNS